nr:hypothetical protein [Pandoravirus massiliensis]
MIASTEADAATSAPLSPCLSFFNSLSIFFPFFCNLFAPLGCLSLSFFYLAFQESARARALERGAHDAPRDRGEEEKEQEGTKGYQSGCAQAISDNLDLHSHRH